MIKKKGKIKNIYNKPKKPDKKALISYIIEPFLIDKNSNRFYRHQNKWQAIKIVEILNDFGYSVDLFQYDYGNSPKDYEKYDLLFGIDPNFEKFAQNMKKEVPKIYYATGMHWKQRNKAEKKRIKRFNKRNNASLSTKRKLDKTDSLKLADHLIVIGDEYTKKTYTTYEKNIPTYKVRLSSFDFLKPNFDNKDFQKSKKKFLWFSGGGLILKGLDLVLETFNELENLELFICGPTYFEYDFYKTYKDLFKSNNIKVIGNVNVKSDKFKELTNKCAFIIQPSASEGTPGSVVTCMHRGLIPLVTDEVRENLNDWGIKISNARIKDIKEIIVNASKMKNKKIKKMASKSSKYAKNNHTKETFTKDFRNSLKEALAKTNKK
ncbi:hypothetical protein C9439_03985 [archaeon SCG-AAA382B04]|nr:hypothetical protein C9439_03985 [archaeon SCG-AAA382B04]